MSGAAGGPVLSQAWRAWIRGPGFFLERGSARVEDAGGGCAGLQRPEEDWPEVFDVLCEQPSPLRGGPREDVLVDHCSQFAPFCHAEYVVVRFRPGVAWTAVVPIGSCLR